MCTLARITARVSAILSLSAIFALGATGVSGCASGGGAGPGAGSAHAPGKGEVGLGSLRSSLGLMPVVGRAERTASGFDLVEGDDMRVPVVAADGTCHEDYDAAFERGWRIYDGDPGVALAFAHDSIDAWWFDAGAHCMKKARIVGGIDDAPAKPKDVDQAAHTWRPDTGKPPSADADVDAAPKPIALPGLNGARYRLTAASFELLDGAGKTLVSEGGQPDTQPECGSDVSAALTRVDRADGSVLLKFERSAKYLWPWGEEPCDPTSPHEGYDNISTWVAIGRDGKVHVEARNREAQGEDDEMTSTLVHETVLTGGAALRFEHNSSAVMYERNSGGSEDWSWEYVEPGDGTATIIATMPARR